MERFLMEHMLDYIIVGAGLSGITVAEELIKRKRTVKVFENHSQSSSTVAGGVYNPVILKKFTLAWNAGEQLEMALAFYRSLEEKLKVPLLEELPIYRKFNSVEEQNNWFQAMDKTSVAPFLDPELKDSVNPNVPSQFSFGRVKGTGRINTVELLNQYRIYLKKMASLITADFEYDELVVNKNWVTYNGIKAERVIFCEGFGIKDNPYFNSLPLTGNKGEYLIVKAPDLDLQVGVKSSVFILPQGGDLYKVGATYDHTDKTQDPTKEAEVSLKEKLSKLISCEYEVVDQIAGIRPATKDRRPMIGQHPEYSQLYCCNGFGSRGVLIAPVMAKELVDHLEDDAPLNKETDVSRFF